MDSELNYFITHFIQKTKQERMLYLVEKDKFAKELPKFERSLNKKCVLVEKNAEELFLKVVKERAIKTGYYIDEWKVYQQLDVVNLTFGNDSLFICVKEQLAFLFHHEGWLYFCKD